jgi:hypothetical protein
VCAAALDHNQRLALTHNSSLQSMVANQAAAAAAIRQGATLGGAPLILSPRLQGVPTSLASGMPPPLINPADTQQLLYAHYGIAPSDYGTYASLAGSPTLLDYTTDNAGGFFFTTHKIA